MSQFVDHESDIIFSLLTQQDARTIFLNIFCAYPVLKKKGSAEIYGFSKSSEMKVDMNIKCTKE